MNPLVKDFLNSLPYDKTFMESLIFTNNYMPIAINTFVAGGFYGDKDDPNLQEFVDLIDGNRYCIKTHYIESHIYIISVRKEFKILGE